MHTYMCVDVQTWARGGNLFQVTLQRMLEIKTQKVNYFVESDKLILTFTGSAKDPE